MCQLWRADGCLHLGTRARIEKADEAWILEVHDDKARCAVSEQVIATRFGLPTCCFEACGESTLLDQTTLDAIFLTLGRGLAPRAEGALAALGVRSSIYRRGERTGHRESLVVRSGAFIPELMEVPVPRGQGVEWCDVRSVQWEPYVGEVYSLDVEGTGTYVADGVVTHNSIYGWRGATPDAFLSKIPDDHNYHLTQSYRVPRAVHARAVDWIRNCSRRYAVEYAPRDAEGFVRGTLGNFRNARPIVDEIERDVEAGRSVMLIASCSFMLRGAIAELRSRGILFANPYRPSNGAWNPLRGGVQRVKDFLRCDPATYGEGRLWTWREMKSWVDLLDSRRALVKGAKRLVRARTRRDDDGGEPEGIDARVSAEDVRAILAPDAIEGMRAAVEAGRPVEWLRDCALKSKGKLIEYAVTIASKHGTRRLLDEARVTIGTIHSVKGGESDVVYLYPDVSPAGRAEWISRGEDRDGIVRTFYVGMTRARKGLVICKPATYGGPQLL